MKRYVLALDAGTTSSRAILFDRSLRTVGFSQKEFPQIYPKEGWVEHAPSDLWESMRTVMYDVIRKSCISPNEIASIGITNQRETTLLWNRKTGQPIANAIVWQCRRTAPIVETLIDGGHSDLIYNATGLRPDAYFSATKIRWLLDTVPGAQRLAEKGDLAFGTVDSWLLWNLTGGKVHATDRTNASRTMLWNLHTFQWDNELLKLLNIPASVLPEVFPSAHLFGTADVDGTEIPVCGIAGDQQSALFGQGCVHKGDVKNTYGTGCFTLLNTGSEPLVSRSGLVTTMAASADSTPVYALEGSVFVGGAVIQWLRDGLEFFGTSPESEALASSVPDSGGVYLVPAFTGLGAPYWDMYARGAVFGLTRGTTKAHLTRAALESIAFQVSDLIDAMENDLGTPLSSLRVDGGAANNSLLLQFQADILRKELVKPANVETTALGAAKLAGLQVGFWRNCEECNPQGGEKIFRPVMNIEAVNEKKSGWHKAVSRCRNWAE